METVLNYCPLKKKEKSYCEELINNERHKTCQSKLSTRPSTCQFRIVSIAQEMNWGWAKCFDVLEPSAEETLKGIKEKIELENQQLVKEIEELRVNILNTQEECEKLKDETNSEAFLKQLLKELEKLYLTKKEIKAADPPKKSIKLKSLTKHPRMKEELKDDKHKEIKKITQSNSKVNKLRTAVTNTRAKLKGK